ncbi:MAG: HRDC domain-containing protein, partial [Deltaproteobacteria bacterium]|nr:HRDC domain-containing protein [Deltaproteobacteria bacterium]
DNRARDLDRPPFKVLSDLFLAEVARRLPKELSQLQGIPGASPRPLEKTGPMLLEGIQRGLAAPPVNKLRQPGNDKRGQKPSPEIEERYERLRAWRKAKAEARKVEVQVITPNTVLMGIAKADPRTLEALGQVEGMDAFRLEQHGAEILAQLTSSAPAPKPAQLSLVDG